MRGKKVAGTQDIEERIQSRSTISHRYTHDGKIHRADICRREYARHSSRVDVDPLPVHLDQKCERLTANPVRRFLWWRRDRLQVPGIGNRAEKAIVCCRQYSNARES